MKNRNNWLMRKTLAVLLCCGTVISLSSCKSEKPVGFSIPAVYLGEEAKADLEGYCKVNGYSSAVINEKKQTVDIIMERQAYELMLVKMGLKVMTGVADLVESDTFPYFLEIGDYAEDFSAITLKVDADAYRADPTSSMLPMTVGETCLLYGNYTTEKKPVCKVTVADAKTGEVLYTEKYKNVK